MKEQEARIKKQGQTTATLLITWYYPFIVSTANNLKMVTSPAVVANVMPVETPITATPAGGTTKNSAAPIAPTAVDTPLTEKHIVP